MDLAIELVRGTLNLAPPEEGSMPTIHAPVVESLLEYGQSVEVQA